MGAFFGSSHRAVTPVVEEPEAQWKVGAGGVEEGHRPDQRPGVAEGPAQQRDRRALALSIAGSSLLAFVLTVAPTWLCCLLAALLWKGRPNVFVHVFFVLVLLAVLTLPCCSACCWPRSEPGCGLIRWLRVRKLVTAVALPLGFVVFLILSTVFFYSDLSTPVLSTDYDAAVPVAVVGSGPSGLTAAWVLAQGGRKVTVFESEDEIGGHSKSWIEDTGTRNLTIDLGFIFNSMYDGMYISYKDISKHFGVELLSTALNTSGYFDGEYWDNTGDPHRFDAQLREEIDRFMEFVRMPASALRLLTPLAVWLWYHGFSERFRKLCLDSTMSVLFVTKMGLDKQSAQAVLNYFKEDDGEFSGFTHLRYRAPKVQLNPGGSQFMWHNVVADMEATGRVQVKLNSRVTSVEKDDGRWAVRLSNGALHGGFSDIVMACPAHVTADVVQGHPMGTAVVAQVEYVDADVTLHTDAEASIDPYFQPASDEVLYFVAHNQMTGKIGKIFQDPSSPLLLSVHGQEQDSLRLDPAKVKWKTTWKHHYFSLWEIIVARKFVPLFNHQGGMHYAGDWLYGVGHDDAIRSGVNGACAAGVPAMPLNSAAEPLYSKLLKAVCQLP